MRYSSLSQLERNLLATGNNGEYRLRKIAVPVPGEDLTLEGVFCTPAHRSGYYHAVAHPKERVVLHFTAGQVRSDLSALTRQDYHVSVPFVIGRDGTIYQLYSSKYWSGNIGKGIGNTGNAQDKCTIGIEISNYGYLAEREGKLETYYSRLKDKQGRVAPVDVYCSLDEREAYQKLATPYRNQAYYATYTQEQYDSLIVLLRYLTAQYHIPRQFLPEPQRYTATNDVLNFRGIVSHVNYRDTGKWDIGPAFDWNRVMQGVQADQFTPASNRAVFPEMPGAEEPIRSEEELESLSPAARGAEFENEEYEDINSTDEVAATMDGKSKKLYALIVGINQYQENIRLDDGVRFPRLRGCVNDAEKIEKYLKNETSFEHHIEMLTDKQATKEAIVDRFQNHLGKAVKGDTVLFYFSGHGTQEWADEKVWTSDSDGRLECIACYYEEHNKDNFLLADKELRFLIKGVTDKGAHVVAVSDCCHSGDNTRNGMFVESSFQDVVQKRIPFVFKQRAWERFVFSNQLSRENVMKKGDGEALPEGLHVQLSACESDESAVEVAGEGVFTKALIETLTAAKGDVTYQALRNRVRQYLRNIYEQKPRIYVVNGDENLLYTTFLNQSVVGRNLAFGDVLYNKKTGWQLSFGAIHGIGANTKSIRIFDPEDHNKEYTGTITDIKADISLLKIANAQALDKGKVYKGYIENILSSTIRVKVKNVDGTPEAQQALMQQLVDPANGFLMLDEKEALYVVHNSNGLFYITRAGDDYRPLVLPVKAIPESVDNLIGSLRQIAQWEHLKGLVNKQADSNLTGNELSVKITAIKAEGPKEDVPIKKEKALIDYEQSGGKWKADLEIELTNTTNQDLYCCALFLTYNFGAVNKLLPQVVEYIEAGRTIKLQYRNKAVIPFVLNEEIEWYNWKQQDEYLKLIVSTEEFDAATLALDPLPAPKIPKIEPGRPRGSKGLDTKEPDTSEISGWGTQTVLLHQPNPVFNNIDPEKLQSMLEDPETADFALGIYFDVVTGEDLQPTYKLKRSIKLRTGRKGFFGDKVIDLANWWARRKRNNYYRDIINKFPNRIRIVSEGDSWFQHPLVVDIIDHLSRTYAIYCVAAAGDTLRNYLSGKKENGEYFLDAIEREQPTFFLISGGGNDILGAQFRTYLNDNFDQAIDEGKSPERFLRESIFKEMNALADIYRSLFQQLKQTHPNLQIIVHGYDYPVKLDDAKKGWLGRYMIEKGISRPGDRQSIIRHIMDEFNRRMKEVALEFDNVTYIDLRGTVRYNPVDREDQWYDEIHPNDEGFQQIAMKFMQKISEKSNKP